MLVGLVLPAGYPGTAAGDDAFGMLLALWRRGVDVKVFSQTVESELPVDTFHFDDLAYQLGHPEDLVIYHQSTADQAALPHLRRLCCRLVVKYHGGWPARSLLPYSQAMAADARRHRMALQALTQLAADTFLAANELRADELRKLGTPPDSIRVVPSFHAVDRLWGLEDSIGISQALNDHSLNVAVLDDLAPWSNIESIVCAVELMHRDVALKVGLHFAGTQYPALSAFTEALMQRANRAAPNTALLHPANPDVHATLLRHAEFVATAQPPNGPASRITNALGFGCPIIALPNAEAVAVGGAAVQTVKTTAEFAARAQSILLDQELHTRCVASSRDQYHALLTTPALEERFIEVLQAIRAQTLVKVQATTLDPSGDWFGIPGSEALIAAALAVADLQGAAALHGDERRRRFVDWVIREGHVRSTEIADRLDAADFLAYARAIEVPAAATQLDAGMRLFWRFDTFARSTYKLMDQLDVSNFVSWFRSEAASGYKSCSAAAARAQYVAAELLL